MEIPHLSAGTLWALMLFGRNKMVNMIILLMFVLISMVFMVLKMVILVLLQKQKRKFGIKLILH
jgi:hypothetical protein